MRSEYEFEYQYSDAERKRHNELNVLTQVGPLKFAATWCLCFLPSIICLLWLEMWSVALTTTIFILAAGFVPLLNKSRSRKPVELRRSMKLTAVGTLTSVGESRSFQKWNSIDEVTESEDEFLFSRNQRYSLLPKRVIDPDQLPVLRQQIAQWRNQPQDPHLPAEMYRSFFQSDNPGPLWDVALHRDDLVTVSKTNLRQLLNEDTFGFKDVQAACGSSKWRTHLMLGILVVFAIVLIIFSLPPKQLNWAWLAIFICLNPLVLLLGMARWIRWTGIKGIPRFHPEDYKLRLLDGGWAIGSEEIVNFNTWTRRTAFFLGKEHLGIASDFGVIHIIPGNSFSGLDGRWQFVDHAIRLKKQWLEAKNAIPEDVFEAAVADNETLDDDDLSDQDVNPYRSPTVRDR